VNTSIMFRVALVGIVIGIAIFAMLAACTPGTGACAASLNPTYRKPTPVASTTKRGAPSPRPTVTVTKHSTYKLDIDHDDDHC